MPSPAIWHVCITDILARTRLPHDRMCARVRPSHAVSHVPIFNLTSASSFSLAPPPPPHTHTHFGGGDTPDNPTPLIRPPLTITIDVAAPLPSHHATHTPYALPPSRLSSLPSSFRDCHIIEFLFWHIFGALGSSG
jgi:hypothetical protein